MQAWGHRRPACMHFEPTLSFEQLSLLGHAGGTPALPGLPVLPYLLPLNPHGRVAEQNPGSANVVIISGRFGCFDRFADCDRLIAEHLTEELLIHCRLATGISHP